MEVIKYCTHSATADAVPASEDVLLCSTVAGTPETNSRLRAAGQSILYVSANCSTSGTISFNAVFNVRNWAINLEHAGSYSFALTTSRTYAFSSFSVVLMIANKSAKLSYISLSRLSCHSRTSRCSAYAIKPHEPNTPCFLLGTLQLSRKFDSRQLQTNTDTPAYKLPAQSESLRSSQYATLACARSTRADLNQSQRSESPRKAISSICVRVSRRKRGSRAGPVIYCAGHP